MERVVVLGFTGTRGDLIANSLTGRLWESDFYRVVDRAELVGEILPATYDKQSAAKPRDILDSARRNGIDGVVFGDVLEYECTDKLVRRLPLKRGTELKRDPERDSGQNQELDETLSITESEVDETSLSAVGRRRREHLVRRGRVTLAFRLIEVESGEIHASRRVSQEMELKSSDSHEPMLSPEEVLEELTQRCLDEILAMLAPQETSDVIALARADFWTRGKREVRRGALLAAEGDWVAAEAEWRQALNRNPKNHAALFNLAVSAAQQQNYPEAEELAREALNLQHRVCYVQGLETIRRHRRAFGEVSNQKDDRVIPASAVFSW